MAQNRLGLSGLDVGDADRHGGKNLGLVLFPLFPDFGEPHKDEALSVRREGRVLRRENPVILHSARLPARSLNQVDLPEARIRVDILITAAVKGHLLSVGRQRRPAADTEIGQPPLPGSVHPGDPDVALTDKGDRFGCQASRVRRARDCGQREHGCQDGECKKSSNFHLRTCFLYCSMGMTRSAASS